MMIRVLQRWRVSRVTFICVDLRLSAVDVVRWYPRSPSLNLSSSGAPNEDMDIIGGDALKRV